MNTSIFESKLRYSSWHVLSLLLYILTGEELDKDSDDNSEGDNSASELTTPASSVNSIKTLVSFEIEAEPYEAIDSYKAGGPGEVSFEIGDTIHVLDKMEDGTYRSFTEGTWLT